ncbi:hypothetical protein CEXT_12961 [Caerostris extrusa]|uniref:Uncharacterized protein n=1 Tax=Caerostris extrusa TaxID=172846 RepID=A0AAV4V9V9_CAEEX|nr:hypothetical protein CEXT_12961 [Caerostris extrusa]
MFRKGSCADSRHLTYGLSCSSVDRAPIRHFSTPHLKTADQMGRQTLWSADKETRKSEAFEVTGSIGNYTSRRRFSVLFFFFKNGEDV